MPARAIGTGSLVGGRYEILGTLGAGGMATVFKAHDRALDVSVALKVLKASPSRDPELAQRFKSEIKLAWRVRHRNVCGIHEYGEDGDLLFISMELVEGKDLRRLLREGGPFVWELAYDVAVQIAEGLEAIHAAGVIHRDLKPANITLDARGLVRLMDFGIAKVWGEDSGGGVTRTDHVVGSPDYMSPEQVRGHSLDFRSDLYALGLVIYELFTGTGPFRGKTPAAAMMRRLEEDPDWEGPAARQIPSAAQRILRRALAREPADRYATCGEILADLRAARAGLPRQATSDVSLSRGAATPSGQASSPVPIFSREAQARLLVSPLVKAMKHANPSVRLGAVEALGRLGGEGLVGGMSSLVSEALQAAQRDEDEHVRSAAGRSLVEFERAARALETPRPTLPTLQPMEAPTATVTPSLPSPLPVPRGAEVPKPAPGSSLRSASCLVRVAIAAGVAGIALVSSSVLLFRQEPKPVVIPPKPVIPPTTTAAPPPSSLPAATQPSETPPPVAVPVLPPSTAPALATKPRASKSPIATLLTSLPSPSPEPTEAPQPPATTLEPIPAPEAAVVPSPSSPTVTPAPAPVVPAVCLSCPIPEAAVVLRERLGLPRAIRLKLQVSETGQVLRVDYLAGAGPLRDAITKAALRWRYRPAQRGDQPVASFVQMDIELQ